MLEGIIVLENLLESLSRKLKLISKLINNDFLEN